MIIPTNSPFKGLPHTASNIEFYCYCCIINNTILNVVLQKTDNEIIKLDLYERLFNHRPFLQGEIKHFVKEFEEKRGDREARYYV